MKKVTFKQQKDMKKREKMMTMCTRTEDSECRTYVRKNFEYKVKPVDETPSKVEPPRIDIKKIFDSRRRVEKFCFEVQGCFYMNHKRSAVKVDFHHKLYIHIIWKPSVFSPKKSEALTN